ncbi:MAG: hypothetical protein ABH871_02210 [Pseudomonadota bacterium]
MLKEIPTEDHLVRMYYELAQRGAISVGEKRSWPYDAQNLEELFCLGAEMSRFDPRLFDILVAFLDKNWSDLNPSQLRSHYAEMRTPQTIAIMAEFLLGQQALPDEKQYFLEYLQEGLKPVPLQLFYQYLYTPGGNLMRRAVESSLREYKRWGFLAREAPVLDEAGRLTIGSHDADSRRNILIRLLEKRRRIRLAEYIAALDNRISRQQALLDMKSIKGVRLEGRGPGARWILAA